MCGCSNIFGCFHSIPVPVKQVHMIKRRFAPVKSNLVRTRWTILQLLSAFQTLAPRSLATVTATSHEQICKQASHATPLSSLKSRELAPIYTVFSNSVTTQSWETVSQLLISLRVRLNVIVFVCPGSRTTSSKPLRSALGSPGPPWERY